MRRGKSMAWILALLVAALGTGSYSLCFGSGEQQAADSRALRDEPEARALYAKMIETIRRARSLSYESAFRNEPGDDELDHCTYGVWMKKPNYFRVEAILGNDYSRGVVVGDGQHAWSYWPRGRPWFSGEDHDAYQETRFNVYMKEPAPPGKYAIRYAAVLQKSNCFPVIDPSLFQGIKDTLEPFIDWIRTLGAEKVGDEDCSVIEVSYMDHRRSRYFWISRRDNLPRKLKRVVRTTTDLIDHEQWSKVTLNAEIPAQKFVWQPPEDWAQWHRPGPEDRLLKPGQHAPDFEHSSTNGDKIRLSAYRGKIVWLTFWRMQCPPCRVEIPYLETLHRRYKNNGLVVLGFDFADDRESALDFLREKSITFPNIIDSSDEAVKTGFITYGARAAPVNYVIDREGEIAAAWLGYDDDDKRGLEVLERLGLK